MIYLNVGNTWDTGLLAGIGLLHRRFPGDVRVTELYGSVAEDPVGSARPDYRLPRLSSDRIERFIGLAHNQGILINYTLNVPCLGAIEQMAARKDVIVSHLRLLQNMGVDRLTVSHPWIMELATENTILPIEVSTIHKVDSLGHMEALLRQFRIDKICVDIFRNRHLPFLRSAQLLARQRNADIELLANEFCNNFGYPCVFRASCFDIHGHGGNSGELLANYPMGRCVQTRSLPASWLKAKFILPEDLGRYSSKAGIQHFKVTGRTHPTSALLRIVKYYVSGVSPDNLLDLWVDVRRIGAGRGNHGAVEQEYIPAAALVTTGFTDRWLDDEYPCEGECGLGQEPCDYCDRAWARIADGIAGTTPSRSCQESLPHIPTPVRKRAVSRSHSSLCHSSVLRGIG